MESSSVDDADAVSVEALLQQLDKDSEDLEYSLGKFTSERHDILASQQRALAEYEAEISRIEAEYGNKGKEPTDTKYVLNNYCLLCITTLVNLVFSQERSVCRP